MTAIADSNWLHDAELRECSRLARALLIKYQSTIPAVVFTVDYRERGSTAHTDIRINPCWGCCRREEMRRGRGWSWWKDDSGTLELSVDVGEEAEFPYRFECYSPVLKVLERHSLDFGAGELYISSQQSLRSRQLRTGDLMTLDIASTNSLLAISRRKWSPPFLMQISVSCRQ